MKNRQPEKLHNMAVITCINMLRLTALEKVFSVVIFKDIITF